MTEAELFDDLKQFMLASLSQATAGLATKEDLQVVEAKLDTMEKDLLAKIEDLDLKLNTIADAYSEQFTEQDHRLTRLERRAA